MHTMPRAVALVLVWTASTHAQTPPPGTWHGRTPIGFDVRPQLKATDGASTGTRAAPGLTGTWQGRTPNGFPLVLELTTDGTTLSGTLTRDGQPGTIAKGTVSQDTFAFEATLGDRTEALSGKLDGDQITVWLDRQGPSAAAVLTRVVEVK